MNIKVDISKTVLETERLIIRPWEQGDLQDFYSYASVDGVGQMAGWIPHKSIDESQEILNLFIKEKRVFALLHKDNRKVIGSLGLEQLSFDLGDPYTNLKGIEIGYVLNKKYWGQSLMPEAVNRVIKYCFTDLNCDFIQCCHSSQNIQSKRVIEKAGFTHVKDIEKTRRNDEKYVLRIYTRLKIKE